MGSTYTPNLGLRKPANKDTETYDAWEQVVNGNLDIIDLAFGNRAYTEQNYIANSDSHSQSLNKLDMKLKDLADVAPTSDQKAALAGEGTPSGSNLYTTKSYVRMARKRILFPEFPSAVFCLDGGGANVGTLLTNSEVSGNYIYNHYKWLSAEATLQTYDISIQYRIPETFLSFNAARALIVDICTEEAANTNNKMDVILSKDGTAGTSSSTGNFSTVAATWYSEREGNEIVVFTSGDAVLSTLSAGDTLNILIRMYSKSSKYVKIGAVTIQYEG